MKEEKMQKSQGFEGELIIEIPQIAVKNCEKIPLIRSMFISRMGYYPKALNHYYERPTGISQVIFIYCTDGEGWVQLQREKIKVKAGEIIIIPKNKSHSYGADTKNPWSIYWFHFSGMQSDEVYEAIMVNKVDVEAIQVGFWEERNSLFRQIASIFLKGYSPTNLLLANLTLRYYLATFISFEYFQKNENSFQKISPTDQAILYMQKKLIQHSHTGQYCSICKPIHIFLFKEIQTRYWLCSN